MGLFLERKFEHFYSSFFQAILNIKIQLFMDYTKYTKMHPKYVLSPMQEQGQHF